MRYRVWVFREDTGATMPVEFDGVVGAVDEIMRHMKDRGLSDEIETTIIRGKATEALKEHGAYRTPLPVRGCWVLAEVVK